MKQIPLTQGQIALVDDADYDWLKQHKWYAQKQRIGNFYACRWAPRVKGKRYAIYMHREILGLELGDRRHSDHINHHTGDNRRCNLRICTCSQNHMNQKRQQNTSSKFKGVYWNKISRKWQAYINIDKKPRYLGSFLREEDAARAYDEAAKKHFGEFAYLNFPIN